ncbi:MAG: rod shape-determining protein MreD [Paludibacteraceae bacterium]|nr:rod shape-determining protein MreD [Paludibacteraceae bacterium]
MIEVLIRRSGAFVLLILLQVLVLNNVLFYGFINPYFYVLFLITLPMTLSREAFLMIGFLMGIIIDIFSGTLGYHASACVLLCYLIPYLQDLFGPRNDHSSNVEPSFKTFGSGAFMQYALILVVIHHFCFLLVEHGSFSDILWVLLKTILSSVFTFLMIWVWEIVKSKK